MVEATAGASKRREEGRLKKWLLRGHAPEMEGPFESEKSPHHEHPWWKVMCLTGVDYFSTLGYQPGIAFLAAGALSPVATDFVITITLSAADATAHVIENHYVNQYAPFLDHRIAVTLVLVALLGAVFLKGFKEAIGLAVILVGAYLLLNLVVIGRGLYELFFIHPEALPRWAHAVLNTDAAGFHINGNWFLMIGAALYVFPKLALGLSG